MPFVREILFTPDVEEKLWRAHGLTPWDVRHVISDPQMEARWDIDPSHGGRVIVRGRVPGRLGQLAYVSLRPVRIEDGVWACITAFVPSRDHRRPSPQ